MPFFNRKGRREHKDGNGFGGLTCDVLAPFLWGCSSESCRMPFHLQVLCALCVLCGQFISPPTYPSRLVLAPPAGTRVSARHEGHDAALGPKQMRNRSAAAGRPGRFGGGPRQRTKDFGCWAPTHSLGHSGQLRWSYPQLPLARAGGCAPTHLAVPTPLGCLGAGHQTMAVRSPRGLLARFGQRLGEVLPIQVCR